MIFVDIEKAYDRVPRDIIWWAQRKKNVGEEYIKIIQDRVAWGMTAPLRENGILDMMGSRYKQRSHRIML